MPSIATDELRDTSPAPRPSLPNHRLATSSSYSSHPDGQPDAPLFRGRLQTKSGADSKASPLEAPPLPRRRSSILSFTSLDETRYSARDYIRPGLGLDGDDPALHEEASNWHSSPIAFAFLPAVAGLFFTNGSAFVTDILLLALAALFLNWSVRIPWDWYHSAQLSVRIPPRLCSDTIDEEESESDGQPNGKPASLGDSSTTLPQQGRTGTLSDQPDEVADAVSRLRYHEVLALALTFVMPICAAYLLHLIRCQLSRPSEGLVSHYNLTIFLLAAEIRPMRQLIRLITNRTLHLQRIANGPHDPPAIGAGLGRSIEDIAERLTVLERGAKNEGDHAIVSTSIQKDMTALSADIRRRYEPRLEALERAVRRYEKRATTLTLLTEQRLQSLEARLHDALSLAAVAAQSTNKPGIVIAVLSAASRLLMLPLEVVWLFLSWPLHTLESLLAGASDFIYGRPKKRTRKNDSVQLKSKSDRKRDEAYFGRQR
ncbi:hypothetical protein AAFC00_002958 [Neodothiora populina]